MTTSGPTPLSASFEALVATSPAVAVAKVPLRAVVRRELRAAAVPLAAGLVVGLAWAALVPFAQAHSDGDERVVAADGVLALIGLVAGLATALLMARRGVERPALRAAVLLGGAVLGSGLSVVVGRLVGAPAPQAYGVLLVWPLTTAVITLFRMLITILIFPE